MTPLTKLMAKVLQAAPAPSPLLAAAIAGNSDIYIAVRRANMVKAYLEKTGRTTITIGEMRKIWNGELK
jgi:hypothetical protein